jgi:hypothetical protein
VQRGGGTYATYDYSTVFADFGLAAPVRLARLLVYLFHLYYVFFRRAALAS